ncbi:hypothetical protein [Desulforhopalus sp. 52FAK]
MSLLQEAIVLILFLPLLLQLVLPLAMLLVYLVSFPVRSLFFIKQAQMELDSKKHSSIEQPV